MRKRYPEQHKRAQERYAEKQKAKRKPRPPGAFVSFEMERLEREARDLERILDDVRGNEEARPHP